MDSVYVVLGQSGEYSDRCVWVAGIYGTEEQARAEVEAKLAQRRVWEQWNRSFIRNMQKIRGEAWRMLTDAETAEASRLAGPKPEEESAEYCEVVKVPFGEWGRWGSG